MSIPHTLGELRNSEFSEQRMLRRGVKDELRENLLTRLKAGGADICRNCRLRRYGDSATGERRAFVATISFC